MVNVLALEMVFRVICRVPQRRRAGKRHPPVPARIEDINGLRQPDRRQPTGGSAYAH